MTPRTKEQNDAIRKMRILEIKKTAVEVYLEKGISMEIGDIANRAGIGRGTIYHYYKNKNELLSDILEDSFHEAKEFTKRTLLKDSSCIHRIELFLYGLTQKWIEKPFIYILYKGFMLDPAILPGEAILKYQQEFKKHFLKPIEVLLEDGVKKSEISTIDPNIVSTSIFGALIGAYRSKVNINNSENSTDDTWIKEVVSFLIKGLEVPN